MFADRAEYLGDPDFVHVPIERLIDPAYIARRAAEVRLHEISPVDSVKPGLQEGMHTTHFSILDAHGNAVANTYTLNDWYGYGVVVEGAGFLLNNEMDDFSAKPGVPNMYGVVGGTRQRHRARQADALVDDADHRAARTATWPWWRARPAARRSSPRCSRHAEHLRFSHEPAAGRRGRPLPSPAAAAGSHYLFAVLRAAARDACGIARHWLQAAR